MEKIRQYISTRKTALARIKRDEYTLAIDFFSRYPTTASLFFQADVPCRLGYTAGGGAPLLTHSLDWHEEDRHIIEYQADLLRKLGIPIHALEQSTVRFRYTRTKEEVLKEHGLSAGGYIVCHIGSGEPTREWQKDKWARLAEMLEKYTEKIIFTGAGRREVQEIQWILEESACRNAVSLAGKLSVCELIQVIGAADAFIGCESFAGHIAAMYQIPQISIMHGAANQFHWQPYHNKNCIVVKRCLDCSPCYFIKLCKKDNLCMDIPLEDVTKAVEKVLKNSTSRGCI